MLLSLEVIKDLTLSPKIGQINLSIETDQKGRNQIRKAYVTII